MLYFYTKQNTPHYICYEQFQSSKPSRDFGDVIGIRCFSDVKPKNYLKSIDDNLKVEQGQFVYLSAAMCFDYKDKEIELQKTFACKEKAMKQFCKLAGVEKVCASIKHAGIKNTNKFTIFNTYDISGEFEIKDLETFEKAYKEGIGTRKSYGFGLILAKPIV